MWLYVPHTFLEDHYHSTEQLSVTDKYGCKGYPEPLFVCMQQNPFSHNKAYRLRAKKGPAPPPREFCRHILS